MKKIQLSFLAVLLGATTFAQKADFSGIWILQEKTLIAGPDYANGVPKKITINQTKDSITITRVSQGENNDEITIVTAALNGEPIVMVTRPTRKRSTIVWLNADKKEFTETAAFTNDGEQKPDLKIIYTWSLTDEGNTITLLREDEDFSNGEKFQMKGLYKKQ
ncbi:MAG: hypothetical protein ACHQIM_20485 [Sphingobacteriales bacterium]